MDILIQTDKGMNAFEAVSRALKLKEVTYEDIGRSSYYKLCKVFAEKVIISVRFCTQKFVLMRTKTSSIL